jgi:hypothetical protein
MKRVAGFPLATIALKMSGYRWDSKAPMPFGALLSAGSKLIRGTIGDDLVLLAKPHHPYISSGNCVGSPLLPELFCSTVKLQKTNQAGASLDVHIEATVAFVRGIHE